MLAAALADIAQVATDLAVALHAATLQPELLALVLALTRGDWRCAPGIVVGRMYRHHPAQASHRMLGFVISNECVPYRDSLAKYAAAFLGCRVPP